MNYLTTAVTDIGIRKDTNQDALTVKVANTNIGKIAFVVLCDGMGGLEKGEVASASVIKAFSAWFVNDLPKLLNTPINFEIIKAQWNDLIQKENYKIARYGEGYGIKLGTTVTAILFINEEFFILNIGDGRVYYINDSVYQLTKDHTLVAKEVEMGILSLEEAEIDPRKNILLQCVGASKNVIPDFFHGKTVENSVYMLCTDGFRHKINKNEILDAFHPDRLVDVPSMETSSRYLVQLNKERLEGDNISVILIRTY